jgi:hypothetical protein
MLLLRKRKSFFPPRCSAVICIKKPKHKATPKREGKKKVTSTCFSIRVGWTKTSQSEAQNLGEGS